MKSKKDMVKTYMLRECLSSEAVVLSMNGLFFRLNALIPSWLPSNSSLRDAVMPRCHDAMVRWCMLLRRKSPSHELASRCDGSYDCQVVPSSDSFGSMIHGLLDPFGVRTSVYLICR